MAGSNRSPRHSNVSQIRVLGRSWLVSHRERPANFQSGSLLQCLRSRETKNLRNWNAIFYCRDSCSISIRFCDHLYHSIPQLCQSVESYERCTRLRWGVLMSASQRKTTWKFHQSVVIFQLRTFNIHPHDMVTANQHPRPASVGAKPTSSLANTLFLTPQRPFHRPIYPACRDCYQQPNGPSTKPLFQTYYLHFIPRPVLLRYLLRCYVRIFSTLFDEPRRCLASAYSLRECCPSTTKSAEGSYWFIRQRGD
jgi:hypothetical protein